MKKMISAAVVAMMMASAVAQTVTTDQARYLDLSKLTTQQKADLMKQAAQMETAKNSGASEAAREEINKWSELGVGMGKAAVSAAKEIGVAANDFVQTPLGKITMAIVVYKIMGKDLIKALVGGSILVLMMTIATILAFRKKGDVKYENIPVLGGLWVKKRLISYSPDGDTTMWHFVAAVVCAGIGMVVGLNIIF